MGSDLSRTKTFKHLTSKLRDSSDLTRRFVEDAIQNAAWVVILKVLDSPHTIEMQISDEFTLGRTLAPGADTRDYHVDLTKHYAERFGVSRRHAAIRIQGNYLVVCDLNSTNGTFINGYRLPAHANMPLRERDILELGKLRLQMVLAAQVST